jgi:cytoskeletal protein CcmA (bactofilin family)
MTLQQGACHLRAWPLPFSAGVKPWLVLVAWLSLLSASCHNERQSDLRQGQMGRDLFSAGSNVELPRPSIGDVVMAGGTVEVNHAVAGDGIVAGGNVSLNGTFGGDLYAAGGQVQIDGKVEGNTRIAGGNISFGPRSELVGGVSVAAGKAEITGTLRDYLQLTAATVRLNASVGGDVDVTSPSLEVGPGARIAGNLIVRGPNPPQLAHGAVVQGNVRHITPTVSPGWVARGAGLLLGLVWIAGLTIVGTALFAACPTFARAASELVLARPGHALLVGTAVLLGGPFGILVLFLSVIGVPFGLLLLYVYVALLPLGYLVSAMALAEWVLNRWPFITRPRLWRRALFLLSVLLLIRLAVMVPIAGKLVPFVLSLLGAGSLVANLSGLLRPSSQAVTPSQRRLAERQPAT